MRLYPLSEELGESLGELNQVLLRYLDTWGTIPGLAWILLGMALMPAVCEELAFRGFILSGFRHMGHKWRAIVLSSVFFGLSHAIFQQSLIATLMGMVIGYIAVQTGSILPGIVYHVCHNALGITIGLFSERYATEDGFLQRLLGTLQEVGYPLPVVICSGFMALGLLYWFSRLKYVKSAEESLQEAIDHHVPQPLTGNASDASA
jgi:sodium transport system permease protein